MAKSIKSEVRRARDLEASRLRTLMDSQIPLHERIRAVAEGLSPRESEESREAFHILHVAANRLQELEHRAENLGVLRSALAEFLAESD